MADLQIALTAWLIRFCKSLLHTDAIVQRHGSRQDPCEFELEDVFQSSIHLLGYKMLAYVGRCWYHICRKPAGCRHIMAQD